MYNWLHIYKNNFIKFGKATHSFAVDVAYIMKNSKFWKKKSILESIRYFLIIDVTYDNLNHYLNFFKKHNIYNFPDFFEIFFDSIYVLSKLFLIRRCFFINVFADRKNLQILFNFVFKKKCVKKHLSNVFRLIFIKSTDKFLNYLILQRVVAKHFWKIYNDMTNNTGVDSKKYFEYLYILFFFCFKKRVKRYAFLRNFYNTKNYKHFLKERRMTHDFRGMPRELYDIRWLIDYFDEKHDIYSSIIFSKLNFYINYFRKPQTPLKINLKYKSLLNYFWPVKHYNNTVVKNLNIVKDNQQILFLRKNRIFNKSRYSRNRQLYRTGVYWCLWMNVAFVYGSFFFFYRYSINFGHLWWVIGAFMFSIILGRIMKYRYYNLYNIFYEILSFYKWIYLILSNIFTKIFNKIIILLKKSYKWLSWLCL